MRIVRLSLRVAVGLFAVLLAFVLLHRGRVSDESPEHAAKRGGSEQALPTSTRTNLAAPSPVQPPATGIAAPPPAASIDPLQVFLDPAFKETAVSKRWTEQGVTDADIADAVDALRKRGFSGPSLRDPGLVGQFLPARNVQPVFVDGVSLAESAAAGAAIPFALKANYPSPAYSFERWDIRVDGRLVTVKPIGSRSADPAAAVVVPVELDGAIPALAPGTYVVRFEAIGQPVEKKLTIQ